MNTELAALFARDLTRLIQEIEAFPDEESIWKTSEGVTNSAGNLALHLEGNLREFIGRQLGGLPYERKRDLEFSSRGVARGELILRLKGIRESIPEVISNLSSAQLEAEHPHTQGEGFPNRQFLVHLYGHLSYHLGQIDYLRRLLTGGKAIDFA